MQGIFGILCANRAKLYFFTYKQIEIHKVSKSTLFDSAVYKKHTK